MLYISYSNDDYVAHGDTEVKQEGSGSSSSCNVWSRSFKAEINTYVISRCRGDLGIINDAFLGFVCALNCSAAIRCATLSGQSLHMRLQMSCSVISSLLTNALCSDCLS